MSTHSFHVFSSPFLRTPTGLPHQQFKKYKSTPDKHDGLAASLENLPNSGVTVGFAREAVSIEKPNRRFGNLPLKALL